MNQREIKNKIIALVDHKLKAASVLPSDINEDESLLLQGILDSISFLELIVKLESLFDIEIDFGDLDPSEFTTLNNLSKLVLEQIPST